MATAKVGPHQGHAGFGTRAPWWPALATGVILGAVMLFTHRIVAIDDAFISYRYAENLARSGQVVFNLGERVEGATNLLWILVLAGLRLVTRLPLETLSIGTSLVLVIYAVARCQMTLRLIGLDFRSSALIVVAVFGLGDVFLSMTTGLEAALYVALMSEALFAVQAGRLRILGLLIGLIFMTRPEGALVGALLVIPFLPAFSQGRIVLRAALPAVLIIGGTTLWRFLYFGTWIPNSIVDKSFPLSSLPSVLKVMSLPYLEAFAATDISLVVILCIAIPAVVILLFRPGNGQRGAEVATLLSMSLIVALSWSIVARNGGDWMPHFRLLAQYAPCYCLALGLACRQWPLALMPVPIILVGFAAWPLAQQVLTKGCCTVNIEAEPPAGVFSEAAQLLQSVVTASDVVSAEAAGFLPYRLLSTRIHDPVGLMDPYIARNGRPAIPFGKTDIQYTFDQVRPSFMIWHWSGHVFEASAAARIQYTAFCFSRCNQKDNADIILIRNDRLNGNVKDAFGSWTLWPQLHDGETRALVQRHD